jgi:hypothetical protein
VQHGTDADDRVDDVVGVDAVGLPTGFEPRARPAPPTVVVVGPVVRPRTDPLAARPARVATAVRWPAPL